MRRPFMRLCLSLIGSSLLVSLLVGPAGAAGRQYAAIAYSPTKGVAADALGTSQAAASAAAVRACNTRARAKDCWALVWYRNAVGSVAQASNKAYGSGWGYSDSGDYGVAKGFAERYAKETCQKYGGSDCQVIWTARTSTISSTAAGGALHHPRAVKLRRELIDLKSVTNNKTTSALLKPGERYRWEDLVTNTLKDTEFLRSTAVDMSVDEMLTWAGLTVGIQLINPCLALPPDKFITTPDCVNGYGLNVQMQQG
jgi:hypothetical protein